MTLSGVELEHGGAEQVPLFGVVDKREQSDLVGVVVIQSCYWAMVWPLVLLRMSGTVREVTSTSRGSSVGQRCR
jgi:hypothetical protein